MALYATKKLLIAISFLLLGSISSQAQAPHFQPLQPDKVEWAEQVGRHAKVRKDSSLLAEYHYLYGKIYQASGNYLMSKKHFLQSLRIQEARGDAWGLVRLYQNLSNLESLQSNMEGALRYSRQAVVIAEQSNLDKALLRAYSNIAIIYLRIDKTVSGDSIGFGTISSNRDSALHYFSKSEPYVRRIGNPLDFVVINSHIGKELLRRKDRKALIYFYKELEIVKKIDEPYDHVNSLMTLANAHLIFGEPTAAYSFLKSAEKLNSSLPHQHRLRLQGIEQLYARYYQAIGNWKAALEHTQKLHEMEKKQLLADRDGAVSRLSYEYENEKKEAQLASQQKELALKNENLKTQQWFLLAVSALLLLAVGAVAVFYRLYRQKERLSRQNAELVQEQNHRVKNNLQVVSGLLQLQSNRLDDEAAIRAVEDTQSRIEVMAVLQRKLYDADQLTSMRALEFMEDVVTSCLELFGCTQVETTYDIPPALELSPDHAMRVGLIVNELTTNACKYAFPRHPDPRLSIRVWRQDTNLNLRLSDNGPGFAESLTAKKGKQSLGMKIIQLQVEQLYGKYHFDTSDGTLFQMHFAVEPHSFARPSQLTPTTV